MGLHRTGLFGYAAGKVIESFVRFNSSIRQRIIAQFHEWMTGAGLLYLKSAMPQVGCVFTTHATVLGRCVAGNNLPLYSEMKNYVPEELARRFNVISKQSLRRPQHIKPIVSLRSVRSRLPNVLIFWIKK